MQESHPVLSDREHCLLRPDMYIGSIVKQPTPYLDIIKSDDNSFRIQTKSINIAPAIGQLFLEIATNAIDHSARQGTNVKNIKISLNSDTGEISIYNDGTGIDIRKHTQFPDEWLPSIIFSRVRSGQNFNDEEERTTAGRNGYGATLVNIFSSQFQVETADGVHHFQQTFKNNLTEIEPAKVKKMKRKSGFTKITFLLDYNKLNASDMIPEAIHYLKSFVWNLCVVTNPKLNIYLNDEKLPIRNLKDFVSIVANGESIAYDEGTNIQIAVCGLPEGMESTSVIGFVNGIPCHQGTHVSFCMNQIKSVLQTILKREDLKTTYLNQHMMVLINTTIINPSFKTQTKEYLNHDMRKSGVKWKPSNAFKLNLKKTKIINLVEQFQEFQDLKKSKSTVSNAGSSSSSSRRHLQLPGYESAAFAGDPKRKQTCTLILPEGDSAKGFATAGLSVLGRDYYGIFPLKGKPKNIRDCKLSEVTNKDKKEYSPGVVNLIRILGLDKFMDKLGNPKSDLVSTTQLRYDSIMILADQDVDGGHIAGLVINIFQVLVPALMKANPNFITRVATPLVRATHPSKTVPDEEFMTEHAFDEWWNSKVDETLKSKYIVKYFKGLGTSTPKDAKYIFSHMNKYKIAIDCRADECEDKLKLFFSEKDHQGNKMSDKRKDMVKSKQLPVEIDYSDDNVNAVDFLLAEVLPHSIYNNERMLPHVIDGLKMVQRKLIWTLLTKYKNVTSPTLKMAQFAADSAKETMYKHGEISACGAGVNMAKNFPISGNNINLLVPEGIYGDRHGGDAASPRYIYTCAEKIAFAMFPPQDFPVLNLLECEGYTIEPQYMVPVIPFALCTQISGIGTGFQNNTPCCNPQTLIDWDVLYIKSLRQQQDQQQDEDVLMFPTIEPWFEGFQGDITRKDDKNWEAHGIINKLNSKTLQVLDLPKFTNSFLLEPSKKTGDAKLMEKYPHYVRHMHTDTTVNYELHFDHDIDDKCFQIFKDRATISISSRNLNFWNKSDEIQKFEEFEEIMKVHAEVRLDTYRKRKIHEIDQLEIDLIRISEQYRFIMKIIESSDYVFKKKKSDVLLSLERDQFEKVNDSYDYLVNMPIHSATLETLEKLKERKISKEQEIDVLKSTTELDMWEHDLHNLQCAYDTMLEQRRLDRADDDVVTKVNESSGMGAKKRKAKVTSKKPKKSKV